jgi:hypothetical protein
MSTGRNNCPEPVNWSAARCGSPPVFATCEWSAELNGPYKTSISSTQRRQRQQQQQQQQQRQQPQRQALACKLILCTETIYNPCAFARLRDPTVRLVSLDNLHTSCNCVRYFYVVAWLLVARAGAANSLKIFCRSMGVEGRRSATWRRRSPPTQPSSHSMGAP